ncbi:MAG: CTP synthase, partial [Candidatus Omnitrophica bacterium]|nr:CTP synthase [Candidatus Omnitrophota bacterium]
FIHLTLVPFIKAAGELKTKPTQHSVASLREIGIQPQVLLCRTEKPLSLEMKEKVALFCNVKKQAVIEAIDTPFIYEIPLIYHRQNLDRIILENINLPCHPHPDLEKWYSIVNILHTAEEKVKIGVVGKYIKLQDSYKSIYEALVHGAITNRCRVEFSRIDSEDIEKEGGDKLLSDVNGVILPGGFGMRGVEGMIGAIKYCRENRVPFLGICLGLQCSVIEFARNVCGLQRANSTEFDPETDNPVICLLDEQKNITKLGGTMRLGCYPCIIEPKSIAYQVYRKKKIFERHRHRWEFNLRYLDLMEKHGMKFSGFSPDRKLVEIIELRDHPFFIATQFHPEFQSKPFDSHPLFSAFILASLRRKREE